MTRTLTATVKARLIKPIDRDWDDIGARLRDLAWLAHRVLNGAMTRLHVAAILPEMVPGEWKSRVNAVSEKRPGGKPSAYQMTAVAIEAANAERVKVRACAWCAGSGVEPDAPPRKRTKSQPERIPGAVCSRCDGARQRTIGEPIDVPSAIQAGWQRLADRRHGNDRIDVARGAKSLASFRGPAPIAITSSGGVFSVERNDLGYTLHVPLYTGGADGLVAFALGVDGGGAHQHLRRIVDAGEGVKLGDAKILAPKDGRRGWVVVISYSWTEAEPAPMTGPVGVVILDASGSPELQVPGRRAKRLYEGASIKQRRMTFAARRAQRSRHQRDIAAGARGHGRARALEHYHAIDDAEGRWLSSLCQEIAAKASREAKLRGLSGVQIDSSLSSVLPAAKLQTALDWALLRDGVIAAPANQLVAVTGDGASA